MFQKSKNYFAELKTHQSHAIKISWSAFRPIVNGEIHNLLVWKLHRRHRLAHALPGWIKFASKFIDFSYAQFHGIIETQNWEICLLSSAWH